MPSRPTSRAPSISIARPATIPPNSSSIPNCAGPSCALPPSSCAKSSALRGLLNVIPLDATLVRGSHGRVPEDEKDWPVLLLEKNAAPPVPGPISPSDVHAALLRLVDPAS